MLNRAAILKGSLGSVDQVDLPMQHRYMFIPLMMISIPLKTKYENLWGLGKEMFWASFHTLLSLKVILLKLSPNYARNTQPMS